MTTECNSISSTHYKSHSAASTRLWIALAGVLLLLLAVAADTQAQTPTLIVMRAMPVRTTRAEYSTPLPPLTTADVAQIKIGGKATPVVSFTPLLKGPHVLQLMVLLDSQQMLGSNGQFEELENFLHSLPLNVEIGVGWLLQSKVRVVQNFTMDRGQVYNQLIPQTREEASSPKSDNGNPYACLRWLASHWPDADPQKLRSVLMFTDGVIRSNAEPGSGDQYNPDAHDTAQMLERDSIVPYPFFWQDPSPAGRNIGSLTGKDLLSQMVSDASGAALYEGLLAPTALAPLLNRLYSILDSESVVTAIAADKPGKLSKLDVKSARDDIKIFAPDEVMTGNVASK